METKALLKDKCKNLIKNRWKNTKRKTKAILFLSVFAITLSVAMPQAVLIALAEADPDYNPATQSIMNENNTADAQSPLQKMQEEVDKLATQQEKEEYIKKQNEENNSGYWNKITKGQYTVDKDGNVTQVRGSMGLWEGAASAATDSIMAEMIEGTGAAIEDAASTLSKHASPSVFDFFRPSKTAFKEFPQGEWVYNWSHETAQVWGIGLAVVLMGWSLIMVIANGVFTDTKNNAISVVLMFIVACLAIYWSEDITDYFLDTTYYIYQSGVRYHTNTTFDFFLPVNHTDPNALTLLSWSMTLSGAGLVILLILGLILAWMLIKNFLRLFLEVVERYVVIIIMCIFFPVTVATIVSKETKQIFSAYIRMFVSQLFLLMAGGMFVTGFLYLLDGVNKTEMTLFNYVLLMAYLRSAQRLDSYMASMGLNVAQTGSGLFDSIALAGYSIVSALRGANGLRQSAGGVMQGVGVMTKNKGLFKAGTILGIGAKDFIPSKMGGYVPGSDLDFLRKAGIAGKVLDKNQLTSAMVDSAVTSFIGNATRENRAMMGAIPADVIASKLKDGNFVPQNISSISSVQFGKDGQMTITGTDLNGHHVKGHLSSSPLSASSIETKDGIFFTQDNTSAKGEYSAITSKSDLEQVVGRGNGNQDITSSGIVSPDMDANEGDRVAYGATEVGGIGGTVLSDEDGYNFASVSKDNGMVEHYSNYEADREVDLALKNDDYYERPDGNYLAGANGEEISVDNYLFGENNEMRGFSDDDINRTYDKWEVVPGAHQHREGYGESSVQVRSGSGSDAEYGTMYFSSVSATGKSSVKDDERIITASFESGGEVRTERFITRIVPNKPKVEKTEDEGKKRRRNK